MSDDRTNRPDEQTELLREIRDILREQNKLVDQQWAENKDLWNENKAMWEAQRRENRRAWFGCLSTVAVMVAIVVLAMVGSAISK